MNIGTRIKRARKMLGYNRASLAAKLEIPVRTLQSYELGDREPPIAIIVKTSEILGIPVNLLIGTTNSEEEAANERLYKAAAVLIREFSAGSASGPAKDAVMVAIQNEYWNAKTSRRSQKINACLRDLHEVVKADPLMGVITGTGEEREDEDYQDEQEDS